MSAHTTLHTVRSVCDAVGALLGDAQDARMLMSLLLDITPAELSMRPDLGLSLEQVTKIMQAANRRAQGEPLGYCAGRVAFRDLMLDVDQRVLIPRPETEIVVDEVLRLSRNEPGGVAVDIGTGSGAIALSIASEGKFDRVIATDVSADALAVAAANVRALPPSSAMVEFRLGSIFSPIAGVKARVIVSNPPYIAYDEAAELPRSVRDWEPPTALFAAEGGMAIYDRLFARAPEFLETAGWLVVEVDSRRAQLTANHAQGTGLYSSVRLVHDLTGRHRVLVARVKA